MGSLSKFLAIAHTDDTIFSSWRYVGGMLLANSSLAYPNFLAVGLWLSKFLSIKLGSKFLATLKL